MSLPKIEIKSGERVTHPPVVTVDGHDVPGVVGVEFEHKGRMLGIVTLNIAAEAYDIAVTGIPDVRVGRKRVVEIREKRMKRRPYARFV